MNRGFFIAPVAPHDEDVEKDRESREKKSYRVSSLTMRHGDPPSGALGFTCGDQKGRIYLCLPAEPIIYLISFVHRAPAHARSAPLDRMRGRSATRCLFPRHPIPILFVSVRPGKTFFFAARANFASDVCVYVVAQR